MTSTDVKTFRWYATHRSHPALNAAWRPANGGLGRICIRAFCGTNTAQQPPAGQNGRCGYGPRLPLLAISPFAKHNYVDHTLTDQSSIIKFVEDNWKLPRVPGSAVAIAGSLNGMFDFHGGHGRNHQLLLEPITGQPVGRD